jgi:hypothetical protein
MEGEIVSLVFFLLCSKSKFRFFVVTPELIYLCSKSSDIGHPIMKYSPLGSCSRFKLDQLKFIEFLSVHFSFWELLCQKIEKIKRK